MPKLYALLAGIADYRPGWANQLDGCVNDLREMKAFLEEHFPDAEQRHLLARLLQSMRQRQPEHAAADDGPATWSDCGIVHGSDAHAFTGAG